MLGDEKGEADTVILCSEGLLPPVKSEQILGSGMLGGGELVSFRMEDGSFRNDFGTLQNGKWTKANGIIDEVMQHHPGTARKTIEVTRPTEILPGFAAATAEHPLGLIPTLMAAGQDAESRAHSLRMAREGKVPSRGMGHDMVQASQSELTVPQRLSNLEKQDFALVTNPPHHAGTDKPRMRIDTFMGDYHVASPALRPDEYRQITEDATAKNRLCRIALHFKPGDTPEETLQNQIARFAEIEKELDAGLSEGKTTILLDDSGVGEGEVMLPALLATGFVNQHLIERGQKLSTGVLVNTAQVMTGHELLGLIERGAGGVYAYGQYEEIYRTHAKDSEEAAKARIAALQQKRDGQKEKIKEGQKEKKLPPPSIMPGKELESVATVEEAFQNLGTVMDEQLYEFLAQTGERDIHSYGQGGKMVLYGLDVPQENPAHAIYEKAFHGVPLVGKGYTPERSTADYAQFAKEAAEAHRTLAEGAPKPESIFKNRSFYRRPVKEAEDKHKHVWTNDIVTKMREGLRYYGNEHPKQRKLHAQNAAEEIETIQASIDTLMADGIETLGDLDATRLQELNKQIALAQKELKEFDMQGVNPELAEMGKGYRYRITPDYVPRHQEDLKNPESLAAKSYARYLGYRDAMLEMNLKARSDRPICWK